MRKLFIPIFILLCAGLALAVYVAPRHAFGQTIPLRINEIAWMGTANSANDEWIELLNQSAETINLAVWRLEAQDGSPTIQLSGSVPPGGYILLERSNDETLPLFSAHKIYTGALGDSGEYLRLINDKGNVIDEIDASHGWQAGDRTARATMERDETSWHTGPSGGTPLAKNSAPQKPKEDLAPTQPDVSSSAKQEKEQNQQPPADTRKQDVKQPPAEIENQNPQKNSPTGMFANFGTDDTEKFTAALQAREMGNSFVQSEPAAWAILVLILIGSAFVALKRNY